MGVCLKILTIGFAITCAIILTVTLIAVSIKDVANDEICLKYHTISKNFDMNQTPFQQGRYPLQPGETFFCFKRVFILMSLEGQDSVDCVTSDGLSLNLDVTFQYRLRQNDLITMYSAYGDEYQNIIPLEATSAIRGTCANWTSSDFYYNRQKVQNEMSERVDQNLAQIFCDGGFLQLINVRFDNSFMVEVQAVQTAIQDITKAENERQQQLIQAQTMVLQAEQYASITLTRAKAAAEVILVNATAQAMSINATLNSQLLAYQDIAFTLGLEGEALINYIAIQAMSFAKHVTMNVDPPAQFSFPKTVY